MNVPAKFITKIALLLCLPYFTIFCQQQPASGIPPLHIAYTTNLNGAIEDCNCGGDTVGGFNRILTQVKNLRAKQPDLLLLDAGDMLSSYAFPEANSALLKQLGLAKYTALNLGDQEFVESPDFLFKTSTNHKLMLPFLSNNLTISESENILSKKPKTFAWESREIVIFGLVNKKTFDFISTAGLGFTDLYLPLQNYATKSNGKQNLEILLYHGSWQSAKALKDEFPWLDLIIIGGNQVQKFGMINNTAFVETGVDGEFLGHLILERKNDRWEFQNKFIPIEISLPIDPAAQQIVTEYYESIKP